jgi:hypothetical protein
VIENVRSGIEHARDRVEIAAKIRRQHLDARLGKRPAHRADGLGEMPRAAVREIVPVHAGDHDVVEPQVRRGGGNASGLVRIQLEFPLFRRTFRHRAETASSRAKISKDHECGRAAVEALVHVGTPRGFAHRV